MARRISQSALATSVNADPVVRYMVEQEIPLTRTNYLAIAYLGDVPKTLGGEEEAALPAFFQDWRVRHAK